MKNLKGYINNTNANVEIPGEDPSELVLKLFMEKIGLCWS